LFDFPQLHCEIKRQNNNTEINTKICNITKLTHTHTHTQPFNGPLSGTTRVSRYQKKPSPTHTNEEEEGFAQTTRSIAGSSSLFGALSQQGLDPVKPAYNQSRLDG